MNIIHTNNPYYSQYPCLVMTVRDCELGDTHMIKGPGGVIDHLIDELNNGYWLNQFLCERLKVIDPWSCKLDQTQLLNLQERFARHMMKHLDEAFFTIYCSRRLPTIDYQGKLIRMNWYDEYSAINPIHLNEYVTLIKHQQIFQRLFGRNIMQTRNRESKSSGNCTLSLRQLQEKILVNCPHVISISHDNQSSRFRSPSRKRIQEFRNFLSDLLTTLYQSQIDYRIYGDQVNGQDIMLCFSNETDMTVAQMFANVHSVDDAQIVYCNFDKQQEELKQIQSWKLNPNDYINIAQQRLKKGQN